MSVGQPRGKNHHEGCLKLTEIQRNRTTTAICKGVQSMKCISFNITYTFQQDHDHSEVGKFRQITHKKLSNKNTIKKCYQVVLVYDELQEKHLLYLKTTLNGAPGWVRPLPSLRS